MEHKKLNSYRELEVWKKGLNLVKLLYQMTEKLPENERFGLTSQIRRAAVSVPTNIAEGWGRETVKNYIQFLRNTRGSLFELDTLLYITSELNYVSQIQVDALKIKIEEIGRMLNSMITKLNAKQQS
jgi:four helix bundle protein